MFDEHTVIQSIAQEGIATQGSHMGTGDGMSFQEEHVHKGIQPPILMDVITCGRRAYTKQSDITSKVLK